MIEPSRRAVIERLTRSLREDVIWALTGSAAHALHGLDVAVRDVDVLTDEPGALAIERVWSTHVARPVRWSEAETIRSHFGALSIDGVEVELMGAVQTRAPDGAWRAAIDVRSLRRWLELGAQPKSHSAPSPDCATPSRRRECSANPEDSPALRSLRCRRAASARHRKHSPAEPLGSVRVPVMPLAHEIEFYEHLGRRARADELRALVVRARKGAAQPES